MSWARPFASISGYYWQVRPTRAVPTPADGIFVAGGFASFAHDRLVAGVNDFQIVALTPTALVGTVESVFRIQINTAAWSVVDDFFVRWTFPNDVANHRGIYYVFDHYGSTQPTASDTFIPIAQQQVLLSDVEPGIWGFHIVSEDTMGYLTRAAQHYVVRIGVDPGVGTIFGQVTDATTAAPMGAVTVAFNRGLFTDAMTNGTGNFNAASIPAGTWEVTFSRTGYASETRSVTLTAAGTTAVNVSLTPMP